MKRSTLYLLTVAALALAGAWVLWQQNRASLPPLRIGVLHSLSGTMAISEAPLVDAIRLAVEETNAEGGINGQPVEMVVADCRSDPTHCSGEAERLIKQEGVEALFGCWTSSCRKAVKPVVERNRHLLFYPVQYEGLEQSPDIVYLGAAPNQQIIPLALWARQNFGPRFYLVGSDYIFPRVAHQIAQRLLLAQGGQRLGERLIPLGSADMKEVIQDIQRFRPDFVLNTLNGESNVHFFRALKEAGINAAQLPVLSTSIAEVELAAMGPELMAGHYAGWSYFQSLDTPENQAFVQRFRQRFGAERVLDDPMESAYLAVKLWVNSAREVGVHDRASIKARLGLQSLQAPEGIVSVDYDTRHVWRSARIGRARADGQFDIVWQSAREMHPEPYPSFLERHVWRQLLQQEGGQ